MLDANKLRRKLFGIKSGNRVKSAANRQLDLFPLGATHEDIQSSENTTKTEAQNITQQQDKQAKRRRKVARVRMALPENLERGEIILDPKGN